MSTKLYVGNLSFDTSQGDLEDLFSEAGNVADAALILDKFTGRSRGFAFVTMSTEDEAQKAISLIHGREVQGRSLTVNEARPREERSGGGERRGYGGGGGERRGFGGGERRGYGGGGGDRRGGRSGGDRY